MATYKKKGYKKEKKSGDDLSYLNQESTTAEVFTSLDEGASKLEQFLEKNQKWIFAGLAAIIILVGGYMWYDQNIKMPHEQEATDNLVAAQQYFDKALNEKDEKLMKEYLDKALNGADAKYGFIQINEKFADTKAGNLTNYYIGMIYYKNGEFEKAVSYLSKFKGDDDIVNPTVKGVIGDAFVELDQLNDALEYYEKAAKASDNDFTAPLYYFKAGKIALKLGDKSKAKKYFELIKDKYPKSKEAKDIDIYIVQAE
jgi:TolA-binding protein